MSWIFFRTRPFVGPPDTHPVYAVPSARTVPEVEVIGVGVYGFWAIVKFSVSNDKDVDDNPVFARIFFWDIICPVEVITPFSTDRLPVKSTRPCKLI